MDCSQKEESSSSDGLIEVEIKKFCADCKTTKTPLWRSGPSGPKSLCNACGIRYRKKRSPFVGLDRPKGRERKKDNPTTTSAAAATTSTTKNCGKKGKIRKSKDVLKVNLMPLGREVLYLQRQRQRTAMKRQRSPREWGEVERAALLLMALSCGAVFA
ncbi:GATA transcription factor 16-like [Olea europaea var. sylvestris]|uniref:GATA transcription factor 17-like n=1 Tax=Olea europaea subsp. europaea TaxID=158383 RepID=A0A8S0TU11_OLEEU|nr:GATA transcription factor 16-like [Olea europaea var. sylvestris]CAA3007019.1 GATA transcription factor 17-like [Olea europaea subsp. europaea]